MASGFAGKSRLIEDSPEAGHGFEGSARLADDTPQDRGVLAVMGDQAKRFASGAAEIPVGLAQAAWSPVQTAKGMHAGTVRNIDDARGAFGRGEYGQAALSSAKAIPLLGGLIEGAEDKINQGDYAGLLGNTATAAFLPRAIPAIPGAVKSGVKTAKVVGDVAKGAAKGAWKGGASPAEFPIKVRGLPPLEIPGIPAAVASATTGAGIGSVIAGQPGAVAGGVIGAGLPIVKGAVRGGKAVLADAKAARLNTIRSAVEGTPRAVEVPPPPMIQTPAAPVASPSAIETAASPELLKRLKDTGQLANAEALRKAVGSETIKPVAEVTKQYATEAAKAQALARGSNRLGRSLHDQGAKASQLTEEVWSEIAKDAEATLEQTKRQMVRLEKQAAARTRKAAAK